MKEKFLIFSWVTLGSMLILMLIGGVFAQAQDNNEPTIQKYINEVCFEGEKLDTSDLVRTYTKTTNDYFNENIEIIMTNPKSNWPAPDLGAYNSSSVKLCGDESATKPVDMSCRVISVCLGSKDPSPYCVGAISLGFTPERYVQLANDYGQKFIDQVNAQKKLKSSYFCFKGRMESEKENIYNGTPIGIFKKCDTDQYRGTRLCEKKIQYDQETDPIRKAQIEQEIVADFKADGSTKWLPREIIEGLAGTLSIQSATRQAMDNITYVDTEIARAKVALDQTLETYSQLRTAWQMHVKYMDIFANLVKYRDELVQIRKQTDSFPFKFIDATTTHCL